MDFQSAARFGTRRVMVTDYDETAVEVNAKVVDEDTGEVICECESGGGGELTTATLRVKAESNDISGFISLMPVPEGLGSTGYIPMGPIPLTAGTEMPILLINGEFNARLSTQVEVTGDATLNQFPPDSYFLHITGDCTINTQK